MAIMIPDIPPTQKGSVASENELWTELKMQLPDDFYVYHSLPFLTSHARQGEVDFLVAHPRLGLLVLECKGRGVGRDTDGRWYREYEGKREWIEAPMEQASAQIRAIVDGLREPVQRALGLEKSSYFPLVYGWAIAFPRTPREAMSLPVELQPQVVIDSRDIARDLHEAVVQAMRFHAQRMRKPPKLNREDFNIFRSIVCPALEFPETLGGEIDLAKKAMGRLSRRQAQLIDSMISHRRLQVAGGAGTGKTVMALHGARLLAEEGKHVLITCFNSKLRDFIARSVQGWPKLAGQVDVHHFHQLCALAGAQLQPPLKYPAADAPPEEQSRFWREDAPMAILRAADAGTFAPGPWDAVFVDEAQDFAPFWWELIEACCLKDETSSIAVFYDEGQRIFDHASAIPEWGYPFQLRENFRNSRAILASIQPLSELPLRAHPDVIEGVQPTVYQQAGPTKTRQILGELLTRLIEREHVRPSQIAILSPHKPANSTLEGARELAGQPIVHDVADWPNGVLHSSISGFKGLEADVVILLDIDPEDPRCTVNDRYVAASRARYRLFVFQKSHWLAGS